MLFDITGSIIYYAYYVSQLYSILDSHATEGLVAHEDVCSFPVKKEVKAMDRKFVSLKINVKYKIKTVVFTALIISTTLSININLSYSHLRESSKVDFLLSSNEIIQS